MSPRCFPGRFALCLLLCAAFHTRADVKLHGLFSDHMVLQQRATVPVWGWADDGERVTVEFQGQRASAVAKNGRWMVRLKNLVADGPGELKVTGKNTITLSDVLVGEVWVASGQSNMEWSMRASHDPTNEIAKTANPNVRLYTVPKLKSDQPVDNIPSAWKECHPATASNFSAVAYYFARDLQAALRVPVGIIHTSWGGSPAEVWIRDGVLSDDKEFRRDILDGYTAAIAKLQPAIDKWKAARDEAKAAGREFRERDPRPWKPSELYNGMIAPVIPFAIQGAIWYQGESNAGRAHQYRRLFPAMVENWRRDWDQGDFTFLQVQLAPYDKRKQRPLAEIIRAPGDSDWAELREAQNLSAERLKNAGVVVITDVGDKDDIHPTKKEPVGERLALAARHIAYGEKLVWSGPTYRGMKVKRNRAILSFDHVGSGLEARPAPPVPGQTNSVGSAIEYLAVSGILNAPLTGFAMCGKDRKFFWANAEIDGDEVVVTHPQIDKPVAVRYGWADFPVVNLFNREGLPASPFRTDDFPMTTAPKKPEPKK